MIKSFKHLFKTLYISVYFSKAIKFYIHDICSKPNRFDTWAAMSLARQLRLEDKLRAVSTVLFVVLLWVCIHTGQAEKFATSFPGYFAPQEQIPWVRGWKVSLTTVGAHSQTSYSPEYMTTPTQTKSKYNVTTMMAGVLKWSRFCFCSWCHELTPATLGVGPVGERWVLKFPCLCRFLSFVSRTCVNLHVLHK
jgi:hypothetical protein